MTMATEEEFLKIDPILADDAVISIDPIEITPIAIVDPLPAELVDGSTDTPPDAQTFGGPVDIVPADDVTPPADDAGSDVPVDGSTGDGSTGDGTPVDDGDLIKITVIDPFPVDQPGDGSTDVPGDVVPVDVVPVDGGGDEVIGRPVDPQPEWRTLDGTGGDVGIIACEDYPTATGYGTDTPTDVIYTLDPADPLIYSTTAVLDEAPGRPVDPEPNWRGGTAPAPEVESDPAPVHYAASESFHIGLDLL
ncbi:hypothetical protein [Novosphingobium sp. AAP93]|uniref:hypothetical protein n=1 Tax=Novosphingobium sp. AAP93 TaxID=1523427 RepID=UPI0006B8A47A|nr:hypothetical protein [Novosphingobium sp. AAP93]KPF89567.1 hypothetical protein IP83_02105 [Novosphingobium sp. AAP93]